MSQSLATGNNIPLTKIKYLYLLYVLLSARSQAAPRSSALRRVAASGLKQRPSSGNRQQLCQHVYQSVNSLTEQELILMTIWVKICGPTGCLKSLNLSPDAAGELAPPCTVHPLVLYSALLTRLLTHPSGFRIVYILSHDCFGLNGWLAKTISPLCSKIWCIIHSASSAS